MISLIVPTCSRSHVYLDRLLVTAEWQTAAFHDVIVVDFSTDDSLADWNRKICLHRAVYVRAFMPTFNLPRAWNVGIKLAESEYIACTGVDFLFDPHFCYKLENLMDSGIEFGRAQAALLPKGVDWLNFGKGGHWNYLLGKATRRHPLGHAISCARRDWWYEVQGYDERMEGGLGVMDGDVRKRAHRSGLVIGYVKFEDAPVLHQWHERSPLKRYNRQWKEEQPVVVKNEGVEWGQMP